VGSIVLRCFALLIACVGLCAAACRTRNADLERAALASQAVAVEQNQGGKSLAQELAYRRFQVTRKLASELTRPPRFRTEPCPDARIESSRKLLLGSEDARIQPKQLLPLDLLEHVLGRNLQYAPRVARFSSLPPPPNSEAEAKRLSLEVEELSRRRYKAVHYITDYGSPRLIHRPNKARPEWVPGVLATWLVVHDLDADTALCQTQIIVRNDVKDEPIRRKLKSEVRERLIRELGIALRDETPRALARITQKLALP
jgi:hypothetical protein